MKATPTLRLSALMILALSVFAQGLSAQTLDYQNYNVIIFNNLSTSSDIEGRTFVGNDFTGSNSANLGNHLANSVPATDRSFVVGNNILAGNPLNLQRGSLYLDGSLNGRNINFNGGGSTVVDHTIDASTTLLRNYSIAESAALQALPADSLVTLPSGQPGPTKFQATGGADGLAVFNVSAGSIFANPFGQQIELHADANTLNVVINVSGSSVSWTSGNMVSDFTSNYWQGHVLWNFYEATSIQLNSFNFNGAILAPYASITASGNIDGLVVANNLTTSAEVHLPDSNSSPFAFQGVLAPVPEPGSAILLLAAGGLVILVRNRHLFG